MTRVDMSSAESPQSGSWLRRLVLGAAAVAGGNALAVLLFAGTMTVAARNLTVAEFGYLTGAYAIATLSTDISDLGTGMRYIVRHHSMQLEAARAELSKLITCRALVHVSLLLLWVAFGIATDTLAPATCAGALGFALSLRSTLQAAARARQAYTESSVLIGCERGFGLVLIILLSASTVAQTLGCLAAGSLAASIPALYRERFRPGLAGTLSLYREARHFGVAALVSDLNAVEIPMVGLIAGAVASGLFAVPSRLLVPLGLLGGAVGAVLLRELSSRPADVIRGIVLRTAFLVGVGVLLLVLPIAVFADPLLAATLGPDYGDAADAVRFGCAAAVASAAIQPIVAGLQSMHRDKLVALMATAQICLYLPLVALGAFLGQATGAAAAAAFAAVVGLCVAVAVWLGADRPVRASTPNA